MNIQSNMNKAMATVGGMSFAKRKMPNGAIESTNFGQLTSQQAYSEALRREADAMNTQLIHREAVMKRLKTMGKLTPEKETAISEEINKLREKMQNRVKAYSNIDKYVEEKIKVLGGE